MNLKRTALFGSLVVIVAGGLWLFPRLELAYYRYEYEKANKTTMDMVRSKDSITHDVLESVRSAQLKPLIPDQYYLEVPFFCQAPHQNEASWEIHHASCEEAALLMAVYYDLGIDSVHVDTVDAVLRRMIDWQLSSFGVHKDIHADSIKIMMVDFFGYAEEEIHIVRKAGINDIKGWVARGYPVIAPTYGRLLRNPYYKQPGPEYHMVTVVGYTKDRLITHDVGTKRGRDFTYDFDTFKKSLDREGGDCLVIISKRANKGP